VSLLTFASEKSLSKVTSRQPSTDELKIHSQADREKIDTFLTRFLVPFFSSTDVSQGLWWFKIQIQNSL
jgi:hypothetical protein